MNRSSSLLQLIIWAVIVAGAIGILIVVAGVAGIVVPHFIVTILWIVLAVVIAVLAIRFIASIGSGGP